MHLNEEDQNQMAILISKSEIIEVVNSYFRALDEKNFDRNYFATLFTVDAKITRPNGEATVGPENIRLSHTKSFSLYESSQHLLTGHHVAINDNSANVRVNLVAMHMYEGSREDANSVDNFFIAGGVVEVELTRADSRWKISSTQNNAVWRAGNGAKLQTLFKNMAQSKE